MRFADIKRIFSSLNFLKSKINLKLYIYISKLKDRLINSRNLNTCCSLYISKSLRSFKLVKPTFDVGLHSYKNKMQRILLLSKSFILYSNSELKKSLNNFTHVKSAVSLRSLRPQRLNWHNTFARARQFIFYDQSGRRWKNVKIGLAIMTALIILLTVAFNFGLQSNPILASYSPLQKTSSYLPINKPLANKASAEVNFQAYSTPQSNPDISLLTNKLNVYGYVDTSESYLKTNISDYMDTVKILIPEWYKLDDSKSVEVSVEDNIELLAKEKSVSMIPSISNTYGPDIDSSLLHEMLDSKSSREKLVSILLSDVKAKKYTGININFQGLDLEHKDIFTTFMNELYKAFHSESLEVTIMLPADSNSYDYNLLSQNADKVIIMLYKNNISIPSPISPLPWCNQIINSIPVPHEKLVIMFSNYSYNWNSKSNELDSIGSYWNAMEIARKSNSQIFWDSENYEPYFRYLEGNTEHIVRFQDGVTFYNQFKLSLQANVQNIAIHLGTEDPTVWKVTSSINTKTNTVFKNMLNIDCLESLVVKGQGEIMNIASVSQAGKRSIVFTNGNFINSEKYNSYPIPSLIERRGYKDSKEIVLTFDDGPHPVYTPEILDILKENNIKATFFMLGKNIALYPDIVKRIYAEGHEIGSHTFSHKSIGKLNSKRIKLELNSTQRLIQEITGHSTVLFRPPYITTFQISRPEVKSLNDVQNMGYILFGTYVDSLDWQEHSYNNIVKNVNKNLELGNIILLHDSGGNRSLTVKALPEIIKDLKADGYTFTTISQLEGKASKDLMPAIKESEVRYMYSTKAFSSFAVFILKTFNVIILSSIILGALRLAVFIFLSTRQRKKSDKSDEFRSYSPFVSVIIAAYNEEKVICKTITSVLNSNYKNLEVIIIDDGSTDKTSDVVIQTFYSNMKVKLIRKDNGGKASALNLGIKESKGKIIVALDADTVIMPNAIALILRHFADKNVAAVSGNVKVGNVCNLLTRCQHIEYVSGFNLEKRSFDKLNCITVVTGAIGAWRKDALINSGCFADDTLAEDTDLTLTLLEKGYRVKLEDKSIGFTEAPQDLKSFIKQRHRWSYGTLQCLWKHRKYTLSFRNKSLSFIAVPNMILFQYLFQVVAPIIDILFIVGLFITPERLIASYLLLIAMDLFSIYFAFGLENEKKPHIVLTIVQKVIYRWYMSYIVLKSLITACKGIMLGWNKLLRIGNVKRK